MATLFPTALDGTGITALPTEAQLAGLNLSGAQHRKHAGNVNDAVRALEAKVGIDDSADTASLDYKTRHVLVLEQPTGYTDPILSVLGDDGTTTYFEVEKPSSDLLYMNVGQPVNDGGHKAGVALIRDLSATTYLSEWYNETASDDASQGAQVLLRADTRHDSTSWNAIMQLTTFGNERITMQAGGFRSFLRMTATAGTQDTALVALKMGDDVTVVPFLDCRNGSGALKFSVDQNGSLGAFGVAPPAQSAAGTTAADAIACLKAFGLMAA